MWTNTSQHIMTMYSSHKQHFRKLHHKYGAGFTKNQTSKISQISSAWCLCPYMGPLDLTSFNFACGGCHCWYGVPILHHPRQMLKNWVHKGIRTSPVWYVSCDLRVSKVMIYTKKTDLQSSLKYPSQKRKGTPLNTSPCLARLKFGKPSWEGPKCCQHFWVMCQSLKTYRDSSHVEDDGPFPKV